MTYIYMPGIGIILNPHSRSNRQNPERVKRLGFIVGDKGSCAMTQNVIDIPTIVHEFKEKQIDILGISGGDGTNHCTLTTFIKEYGDTPLPKIAFLRGGTMNVIANALQIHGSPEQILSNLILKYHEDLEFTTTEVDLINVNGKYGFIFGNGLLSRFIEKFYENKGGPMDALIFLAKVVGSGITNGRLIKKLMERFDARIMIDGKEWGYKNYVFIGASTMQSLSFGFKVFYRANSAPRQFQTLCGSATPWGILSSFPNFLMGRAPNPNHFTDTMAKEIDIYLDRPETYFLDGDMQDATDHINIKIGPRLTVIVR